MHTNLVSCRCWCTKMHRLLIVLHHSVKTIFSERFSILRPITCYDCFVFNLSRLYHLPNLKNLPSNPHLCFRTLCLCSIYFYQIIKSAFEFSFFSFLDTFLVSRYSYGHIDLALVFISHSRHSTKTSLSSNANHFWTRCACNFPTKKTSALVETTCSKYATRVKKDKPEPNLSERFGQHEHLHNHVQHASP